MNPGMYGPGEKLPPGGGPVPSAPPPSEPPSYEEAIAIGGVRMPNQIPGNPPLITAPYPVLPQMPQMTQMPMPMPTPYPVAPSGMPVPMPVPQLPNAGHMPGDPVMKQPTAQPHAVNGDTTQTRTTVEYTLVPLSLSPNPVKTKCLFCNVDVKTITISDHQPSAHICCIILFCIGCCLCSCLPYFMNAFKRVHHFCPNCKNYLGTWKG